MRIRLNPDKCLACSTCVVHCPVAAATPKFLGPRMIGPGFERFRLLGIVEDASLTYCANCKNCEISCPQNVPVATINMLARLEQCKKNPPSLRDWIVAHGEVLARALRFVPAGLKNFGIRLPITRTLLDALGIARDCPMPKFAQSPFRTKIQELSQDNCTKPLVFFPGCYINYYDPRPGFDLVSLLNRAGYRVLVPEEFVCCGIPLISGGFEADARKNATINAEKLASCMEENIPIISACPSCRLMLTREVGEFFPDILQKTGKPRIIDAQDFILRLVATGELTVPKTDKEPLSVCYHAPCHARALGEGLPGLELLSRIPAFSVTNLNAGCCGISGSYGFKKEKYAIGQRIGEKLFAAARSSGAKIVASDCGTCRLQIACATKMPTLHPITLARAAFDGAY
ncbi:MAG: anaerobic glycerol-3-phosphate dehydrogenase subunit C [Desulfovibrionaceae bacterium]|nr:anaerobic glycerol-3-phosphate dehydrogenase subunit C [Desulfovibrionaceae bacterium]